MSARLICPACNAPLTVSPAAPAIIHCPNCLSTLMNPLADARQPLPVIPIEQETRRDSRSTGSGLVALVLLLLVGAVVGARTMNAGPAAFGGIIAALIATLVGWAMYAARLRKKPQPPPIALIAEPPTALTGAAPTLIYRSYRDDRNARKANPSAVVGGFFSGIGVCAAGFLTLLGTVDVARGYHGPILLGVVTMVLVFTFSTPMLANRPGWRGYGRGVIVGMILGLLALGPCAFCYTMTLP